MGVPFREAVRGEDLLLLTHSLSSESIRADSSGAGQHDAALLAIVEKVESEKELDGSRKLVAYATVCLAGMVCRNPSQQPMSPKVTKSHSGRKHVVYVTDCSNKNALPKPQAADSQASS